MMYSWRNPQDLEKLHFEQGFDGDFGCKEMDEVGDLRKGHCG